MDDRVIPITISNVDWQNYLDITSELLGHSVSKGVDTCGPSKLSDCAKYIASLAEFAVGKEVDAKSALRNQGPALRHISLSFLISSPFIREIGEASGLDILSNGADVAIVTGTLRDWREATIMLCNRNQPERLRWIFNEVKRVFDQLGLPDLFFEFNLRDCRDGTFYLE